MNIDILEDTFFELQHAFAIHIDSESRNEEFEDDGFIHICRGHLRFVFYNGQEKGMLRNPKGFKTKIDKLLKEC